MSTAGTVGAFIFGVVLLLLIHEAYRDQWY